MLPFGMARVLVDSGVDRPPEEAAGQSESGLTMLTLSGIKSADLMNNTH